MAGTAAPANAISQVLREMCARNTPLELHYEEPNSGDLVCGRARALEFRPDAIVTEMPRYEDGAGPIPKDRWITVHLMLNKNQYAFRSKIERSGVEVRLNDQMKVFGLALRPPEKITRVQRRAHYRIALPGSSPISVDLARCDAQTPDACPVDGHVGVGSMVNLSARGVAVRIKRQTLRIATTGDRFYLTFSLPGVDGEFCMLGTARHVSVIERESLLKIGFAFSPWAGQNFNRCQTGITRFIAELERRMLRRKK